MSKKLRIGLLPALFFCTLLAKVLFFAFHNWDCPKPFIFDGFYLLKFNAAIGICCFAFFFRSKVWTVPLSFILDFWIVSNQVYMRSNQMCFEGYSWLLIDNAKGFGGGILALFGYSDLFYPALTILYAVAVILFNRYSLRSIRAGICVAVVSLVCGIAGMVGLNRNVAGEDRCYNAFSEDMHNVRHRINDYCRDVSVLHMMVYDLYECGKLIAGVECNVDCTLSDDDLAAMKEILKPEEKDFCRSYTDTLVIILVEGMESWAVRPDIMPNTSRFIERSGVLYADKIQPQIAAGTSSDGQLIINTGLLPIDMGTVCFTYPENSYPSLAGAADGSAVTIIPHHDSVWNQKKMSVAEGYDATVQVGEEDDVVFNSILSAIDSGYQVVQALTLSSHVPFDFGAKRSSLKTPSRMPSFMAAYAKSMNYTDSNLEIIFRETEEGGLLHNAIVVITGDHTIFYRDRRQHFARLCRAAGLDYDVEQPYCPLIIYSPHIDGNIRVEKESWQMDIYPTVDALLGNPLPVWNGFGVNLLEENDRPVDVQMAMDLSNRLIRNDYFKDILPR